MSLTKGESHAVIPMTAPDDQGCAAGAPSPAPPHHRHINPNPNKEPPIITRQFLIATLVK